MGEHSLSGDVAHCHKALLNVFCKVHRGLKIVHFNARSLNGLKLDYVRHIFDQVEVDILCVTETWFKSDVADVMYGIDGYKLFRNDRDQGRGGGVAIYCRNYLNAIVVSMSHGTSIEYLNIELSSNLKVLISCVYNPHRQCSLDPFFHDLSTKLIDYDFYFTCGDFNINLLVNDTATKYLQDSVSSAGLVVVNTRIPTRYSNNSSPSLLDLCLVSDESYLIKFDQCGFISDHDLIFCSLDIAIEHNPLPTHVTFRDFRNINFDTLYCDLCNITWHDCWSLASVDDKLIWFVNTLNDIFNSHVRLKTVTSKRIETPWFTPEVLNAIKCRNRCHSRWKRAQNIDNWRLFVDTRNFANKLIKRAKYKYYSSLLNSSLTSKELWRNIRKLRIHCKNDTICTIDPNLLNEHFSPSNFVSPSIVYSGCSVETPFEFVAVSEGDVAFHTSSISSNAVGCDGLPIRFIKLVLPYILPTLTHIINHCITTSVFPQLWKIASITPIPKKSRATELKDFRPISILPAFAKVFEKLLSEQLSHHLSKNYLISPLQSGFRPGHSCTTATLKTLDDIRTAFDNNQLTLFSLLDFSKAFDSVSHSLLCSKLEHYFNVSNTSVALIASYLDDRKQRVGVCGVFSNFTKVDVGVPQGSILGPLLFSIFMNDIFSLDLHSTMHAYADDVQLYSSGNLSLSINLVRELNADLDMISAWTKVNGLLLNINKCVVLPICYKSLTTGQISGIVLDGEPLTIVSSVKYLGYLINSQLSCTDHVNFVLSRIYLTLRSLRLSAVYTPLTIRRNLVIQLIMPHINYFCTIYCKLDSVSKHKLIVAFNNITRYVFSLRRFDHVSQYRKMIIGVDILDYFDIRCLIFLHNLLRTRNPMYLYTKLSLCRSERSLQLLLPSFKHLASSRLFFVNVVRLWNALPSRLRFISENRAFKDAIYSLYS